MPRWVRLAVDVCIVAVCAVLSAAAFAQPPPGAGGDRSGNVISGLGVGIAGCIFFQDLSGAVLTRRTRRRAARAGSQA